MTGLFFVCLLRIGVIKFVGHFRYTLGYSKYPILLQDDTAKICSQSKVFITARMFQQENRSKIVLLGVALKDRRMFRLP